MKRTTVAHALAAAFLFTTTQTVSANDMDMSSNLNFPNGIKVYAGAGVGYTTQGNACNTPFFSGDCDETSSGYKVFTGARFNPMLGAELGYVDHGEAAMNGNVGSQTVASNNKIAGYQVAGVGYLPIAPASVPNLDVIGKAGLLFWERETKVEMGSAEITNDDGISALLGLGAQYQFQPNMSVRAEWEHTFSSGSESNFETDIDNYSMSVIFSTM